MNLTGSDLKTNITLKQVAKFFNISVSNVTNQSEVTQEHLFDLYEAYRTKEREQLMTYQTAAYFVGSLIMISNLTVVISSGLILRKGQQPKSTYLLLGNVSLADTLVGFSVIFGAIVDNSKSSNLLCIFQIGMIVCAAMVSIFSVGFIAVDRYFYILHGLYYQRWFNTTRVRIGIICIWVIGATLGFLPITGWTNQEFQLSRCYYVNLFPGQLVLLNSLLSIIPILVVAILYFFILLKALKTVKKIKFSNNMTEDEDSTSNKRPKLRIYRGTTKMNLSQSIKSPSNAAPKTITRSASCNSICSNTRGEKTKNICVKSKSIHDLCNHNAHTLHNEYPDASIRSKTNNIQRESQLSICTIESSYFDSNNSIDDVKKSTASCKFQNYLNKYRKSKNNPKSNEPTKWRAIIVVMLTSGSFIITWMPFFITVIFYVFCENKVTNEQCFKMNTLLAGPFAALAFFNSILNPLIYAWWHKGFKRTIKTYFQKYMLQYFVRNTK